ncbi:MAG: PDZ domain-containing protein [Bryobacteraceae bacterium]|nr:PDZ domain-containing protein [Bryobacteraceae bacterium]MDW8378311.1 PDZ domain-containing protein [Bryobacterales bacterium]
MNAWLWIVFLAIPLWAEEGVSLFQQPTINQTHIVFVFAGDLWSVERSGGQAVRLTAGRGVESNPSFSPDGQTIAFSGEYDGNVDVFTIPARGGIPKRITSHPSPDLVRGWTPDGKRILFASNRDQFVGVQKLYTVSAEGGFPEPLPFPYAWDGSYSPDGSQIAYLPISRADQIWKRYRGGRTTPIWIAKLSDSSITPLPRKDSNDYNPMWVGNAIYFLSDRHGKATLFRYDTKTRQLTQVLENRGLDLKSAQATSDAIVYEQFGSIHLYDLKNGKSRPVNIHLSGDLAEVRPRMEKLSRFVQNAAISPAGARAVFEARGEIFTVPAEKGDVRNLTRSPGVADRFPAWSPDGRWVAFFSDESGEYALHLAPQNGLGEVKKISLGHPSSFFYSPVWSPDSKKIAFSDKRLNLWYVEIERAEPVKVDTQTYASGRNLWSVSWSPDSKWLAYAKVLKNHLSAVFLYSLESRKSSQITDGMSDARMPVFDNNGKYLYLAASTDSGPTLSTIDLSSSFLPVTRTIYLTVLSKDEPSPLAPESDEEKVVEEKKAESVKTGAAGASPSATKGTSSIEVRIDLENIQQRTIPLPLRAANYIAMQPGKSGVLFLLEAPPQFDSPGPAPGTLHRFDLAKRKAERFADGVTALRVSHNGEKLLLSQSEAWFIVGANTPPKPGEGRLRMDEIESVVDPQAEWKQMYREVLRIQRDFFYDPSHHGLDLQALGERYEKYLSKLGSRSDLNYLWAEMWGELSVGHLYISGGDQPQPSRVRGGLLGADYRIENGRYRIAKIYTGENWNPQTRAPLTQPGVNVQTGDYILAVNGRELRSSDEIFSFFEGTAGKTVRLKVASDAAGTNPREVTVTPVESEVTLRRLDWVESNRRTVEQLSGGKVAYVYLPDTYVNGYRYFNRYYFAQSDRQALIVDERFNGGGKAADYIIDYLRRPLWNYWSSREGETYTTPTLNITGPKVMLINEWAGSGGDALPWYFRRAKLGPLVGKRTWGGLVGIGGTPPLIDGGTVTSPSFAFWTPEGNWEVENFGTPPDIEVEFDPKAWREGRDLQLEKAVEIVLEQLRKNPPKPVQRPAYPNYHSKRALASGQ